MSRFRITVTRNGKEELVKSPSQESTINQNNKKGMYPEIPSYSEFIAVFDDVVNAFNEFIYTPPTKRRRESVTLESEGPFGSTHTYVHVSQFNPFFEAVKSSCELDEDGKLQISNKTIFDGNFEEVFKWISEHELEFTTLNIVNKSLKELLNLLDEHHIKRAVLRNMISPSRSYPFLPASVNFVINMYDTNALIQFQPHDSLNIGQSAVIDVLQQAIKSIT